jgi:DNA-binding transcriptional MerR regulator
MARGHSIAVAAEATSTTVDTLRYYERIGVIPSIDRDDGGRRIYSDNDLGWIGFVLRLRATGMPLERVADYSRMVREGEGTVAQRRALLEDHRDTVATAIAELEIARGALDAKIAHCAAAERGEQLHCSDVALDAAARVG